jgi:regulator of protease activity HflC (stomatin/prohibitin superfamily)
MTARRPAVASLLRSSGSLAAAVASLSACATVPPGQAAILLQSSGVAPQPLDEGVHVIGPLATVELYDLRAQERGEDLTALSADGASLEARASVLTFHPMPGELVALARAAGPSYYETLVRPVVRSTVRLVLAGLRADQLDPPGILHAEREITRIVADRLRPHHVVFDAITLRTLALRSDSHAYRTIVDTGVAEQQALAQPQYLELARRRAEQRRQAARGIAASNALVAPTLTPKVLADNANRAWNNLMNSPATHVDILPTDPTTSPHFLEVRP